MPWWGWIKEGRGGLECAAFFQFAVAVADGVQVAVFFRDCYAGWRIGRIGRIGWTGWAYGLLGEGFFPTGGLP